ncbi:MAG: SprB repeat-containing protein [Flavobacteriales bacterium]
MLRHTLLTLLFALIGISASATHMSGGEIYWECLGNNQYRIRLLVYRDCAGIAVDPTYNLVLTSPCGNRNLTVSTNGGVELSQLCDLELPNSTCNGGTLPGIQQYTYTGVVTLPPCDSWRISWTNIYRNNAIVNLTAPGTRQMYIESVLNNATGPCNDSPTFSNAAIPYVCLGYPISYSYGAVDAEADSLSYSLIGARMLNGAPIPYVAPYTPTQPIPGLTLDPVTGLINFTLSIAGNWVVAVLVTEYDDNGNVIGRIMRDMQFVAYPCSNIPPDPATGLVSNMTGTAVQVGPRAVDVCESGDFCFNMVISDANANNILTATSNVQQNLPGATFTYTGTNPITAQVCWTAQPGTAGFFPFIVNVNDGACPISAFQTYVYGVRVIPGLAANIQVTPEVCAGLGNGTAQVVVTTGTGPFNYVWSNGATGSTITAAPGTYTVDVSDNNGCVSPTLSGTIAAGAPPSQANAGADIDACAFGGAIPLQGSVVNATGGAWSSPTGTFSGTWPNISYIPGAGSAGNTVQLTLTSTGNGNCPPATDVVAITLHNSFAGLGVNSTPASCYGGATGSASVAPNNTGLSYLWNDPAAQTTATATALAAGSYAVLVSDAFGCDTTLNVTVGQPTALALANLISTPENCTGMNDGSLLASASGGTAPYTYTWNTGANGPSLTAGAGNYTVSVTDANSCAAITASGTIGTAAQPNVADAGADLVACMNAYPIAVQGTVQNATGGTWSGGSGTISGTGLSIQYTPSLSEVESGGVDLTLTTTGNDNCPSAQDVVHITLSNSFLNAALTPSDASCNAGEDGSIAYSPIGPGLSYAWSDPLAQTTAVAVGLAAGNTTALWSPMLWDVTPR